jgi:hypothetical protein
MSVLTAVTTFKTDGPGISSSVSNAIVPCTWYMTIITSNVRVVTNMRFMSGKVVHGMNRTGQMQGQTMMFRWKTMRIVTTTRVMR